MNDENSQSSNSQGDDDGKPVIVNDSCIGCGICATIAPDVFEMSAETGKSEVKEDADFSDENIEKAKEAAAACPVEAIEVKE